MSAVRMVFTTFTYTVYFLFHLNSVYFVINMGKKAMAAAKRNVRFRKLENDGYTLGLV